MHHEPHLNAVLGLLPETQRKMAVLALAGWTFTYRPIPGVWEVRQVTPARDKVWVWITLSVGIEEAWVKHRLETGENGAGA